MPVSCFVLFGREKHHDETMKNHHHETIKKKHHHETIMLILFSPFHNERLEPSKKSPQKIQSNESSLYPSHLPHVGNLPFR